MEIRLPPKAKWYFTLDPEGWYQFQSPDAPNTFYRLMQRLVLGIHWRRL